MAEFAGALVHADDEDAQLVHRTVVGVVQERGDKGVGDGDGDHGPEGEPDNDSGHFPLNEYHIQKKEKNAPKKNRRESGKKPRPGNGMGKAGKAGDFPVKQRQKTKLKKKELSNKKEQGLQDAGPPDGSVVINSITTKYKNRGGTYNLDCQQGKEDIFQPGGKHLFYPLLLILCSRKHNSAIQTMHTKYR